MLSITFAVPLPLTVLLILTPGTVESREAIAAQGDGSASAMARAVQPGQAGAGILTTGTVEPLETIAPEHGGGDGLWRDLGMANVN